MSVLTAKSNFMADSQLGKCLKQVHSSEKLASMMQMFDIALLADSDEKAATLPPVQACKLKHGLFYSGGKVLENIQCRPQPFLYFREFTKNNPSLLKSVSSLVPSLAALPQLANLPVS